MRDQDDRAMKTLLFLCSGNYYRSRFAEYFFNWHAQARALPWHAQSRGLDLCPGNTGPISGYTAARLSALGIPFDGSRRFPLAVVEQDFLAADHIVAVKRAEHYPIIERDFPAWLDRIEFWTVDDLDCAGPEQTIPHLEREIEALLGRINAVSRNSAPTQ